MALFSLSSLTFECLNWVNIKSWFSDPEGRLLNKSDFITINITVQVHKHVTEYQNFPDEF